MPIETVPPDEPEALVITNARIPISLHQQLARAAKESFRSMNSELIVRLMKSLSPEEPAT
jgi:Arc-like DNA binding domain